MGSQRGGRRLVEQANPHPPVQDARLPARLWVVELQVAALKSSAAITPKQLLYFSTALACLLAVSSLVFLTVTRSEFWDFNVFYSSARAALHGQTVYRNYGPYDLPYWYFPWVAWSFIPLAIFPFSLAKTFYVLISVCSAVFVIYSVSHLFDPKVSLASQAYALGMSLLMCWLLFRTGQVDFILAAVLVAVILLVDKKHNFAAGVLFPLLLFKPHLLAVFIPFVLVRGGKKFLVSALTSVAVLGALALIFIPAWPLEMLRMLTQYGGRTDNVWHFATFAELIGRTENWSGTANLWVAGGVFVLAFLAAWKSQQLPTPSFLALTLAASMLCAPHACPTICRSWCRHYCGFRLGARPRVSDLDRRWG